MSSFKYWGIAIICAIASLAQAQEKKKKVKFYGFVNSQAFFDTRKTISAREGMVYLFPANEKMDQLSNDLYESTSLNHLSMASRVEMKIQDVSFEDFKLSANLEGDFTGMTDSYNNGFRLRQAWIKLDWNTWALRIGQYWHPLFCPEVFPKTLALNTGAPFHPFGRYNQIAIENKTGNLRTIFTIAMQRDYASKGPSDSFNTNGELVTTVEKSSIFQRNANIPNLDLQFQYQVNKHLFGLALDFKQLQPRLSFSTTPTESYKTNDKVNSFAMMAFANLNFPTLEVKVSSVWGQNLSDMVMLGGYYEHEINANGEITYGNSSQLSLWADFSTKWKGSFQMGVFAGYLSNLGYENEMVGNFYGTGNTISSIYRISPRAFWKFGNFMAGPEIDFTAAAYGTPDNHGNFNETKTVSNVRVLGAIFYFF